MGAAASRAMLAMAALALVLSGCSIGGETPAEAAVDLIEGAFGERFDMVLTDARCVDPADDSVGTTFTCTAVHQGSTVDFEVLIDREDHINVSSTNVLFVPALDGIAASVTSSMNQQGNFGLTPDALDCGTQPIVLDATRSIVCGLTEPETGAIYDTTVTISDLDNLIFDFEVAAEPRG